MFKPSLIRRRTFLAMLGACLTPGLRVFAEPVKRLFQVTLGQAHKGDLEIDTMLLDSYGKPPEHLRQFYFTARAVFAETPGADFTDPKIVEAAEHHGLALMGGPLLGELRDDAVTLWLRPGRARALTVRVGKRGDVSSKSVPAKDIKPGVEQRITLDGLAPETAYAYAVYAGDQRVAEGGFTTAPREKDKGVFRITFGSCFHKIGLHNPNLIREILKRKPSAMLLLGDMAVDDRNNQINMHRADYQLRDVSPAWCELAANVPLYTSWDDHDYFDNDLGGIPKRFTADDREAVRGVWRQNWVNPPADDGRAGIYFNTRIGPVEVIMLDTRSCRENDRRKQRDAYLGKPQMDWLKRTLKESTAPFKIITSGTMWSDYVSNGKDSWGTWDPEGREALFSFIDTENITGVLLTSGDRHGARGFTIPRENGYDLYEFEPATLGGVPGPPAMVNNCPEQLFGYHGRDFIAFGEFTFDTNAQKPNVTFRLIKETGEILEEHAIALSALTK